MRGVVRIAGARRHDAAALIHAVEKLLLSPAMPVAGLPTQVQKMHRLQTLNLAPLNLTMTFVDGGPDLGVSKRLVSLAAGDSRP